MNIRTYRQQVKEALLPALGEEAEPAADVLLAEALGVARGKLYTLLDAALPPEADSLLTRQVYELSLGKPLQYVLGTCHFYGQPVKVGPGCFIPRSDTEIAVEAAEQVLPRGGLFADICAGSGCIALALARQRPDARGYALELSRKALVFTEANLEGIDRVAVRRFDALEPEDYDALASILERPLDLIVCNPPYIPTEEIETLAPQLGYEPETALDGGPDGLRFYRAVAEYAPMLLAEEGALVFEIGIHQCDPVTEILAAKHYSVAAFKDYGGIDRVLLAKKY